jgi:hypothetical protein
MLKTQTDLFVDVAPNQADANTDIHDPIELVVHRLAVQFTEDELLPTRYRRTADSDQRKRKPKQDSEVEKRFKSNVQSWRNLIETMLSKLEPEQAWRFINLAPRVDGDLAKVTDNTDFCNFVDYLILRRDKENCDTDELGGLAQLLTAFQREVERRLVREEATEKTEPEN